MRQVEVNLQTYPATNLGDDLFAFILSQRYTNTFHVSRLTHKSSFSGVPNVIPSRSAVGELLFKILNRLLPRWKDHFRAKTIRQQDIFAVAGGSIFMYQNNLDFWERERDFYLGLKRPVYVLGCNITDEGPEAFKSAIREIARSCVDVTVRDEATLEFFDRAPNVRLLPDLVFALEMDEFQTDRIEGSALISVVDGYRFGEEIGNSYFQGLSEMVKQLLAENRNVTLMSFCSKEGDETGIEHLLDASGLVPCDQLSVYCYDGDIAEALRTIGAADLVIGSRFHANILGLLSGAAVLPLSYSSKTPRALRMAGIECPVTPLQECGLGVLTEDHQARLTSSEIASLRNRAEEHFLALDAVLERR